MKKTVILVFAAGTLFLAGCCNMHRHCHAMWEYQKTTDFNVVQKLGADGWELVGFHSSDNGDQGAYYILKRRIR